MNVVEAYVRDATPSSGVYWWAYPSRLALFIHAPIFIVCGYLGEAEYALYKHSVKFLIDLPFALGLVAIIGFATGAFVFESGARCEAGSKVNPHCLKASIDALFAVVLGANAIFLYPILLKPGLLTELLLGSATAMFELRTTLNQIPGVTSFMGLQSLVVVLVTGYTRFTDEALPSRYRKLMVILVAACVLRAWLWSERLALMELILPFAIMSLAKGSPRFSPQFGRVMSAAPLLGLVLVFGVFCVGEYFRSWQFYQHEYPGSFLEFIVTRFAGYYATALNNGAALFALHPPLDVPAATAEWFYKFPLWPLFDRHWISEPFERTAFLTAYLNPEFNNTSGVFMPFLDFGPVLGVVCWIVLGAISGYLFRRFAQGRIIGMVMYPVWFIGIAEILRFFYWGDSRFFPVIVVGLALSFILSLMTVSATTDDDGDPVARRSRLHEWSGYCERVSCRE